MLGEFYTDFSMPSEVQTRVGVYEEYLQMLKDGRKKSVMKNPIGLYGLLTGIRDIKIKRCLDFMKEMVVFLLTIMRVSLR